jgi:hypothetical protein
VTTTISSKGQVVIPQPVRERPKPYARAPKKSLAWHLRRLHGMKLDRRPEPVREVAW